MKILILSANTGEGHNSSAKAIAEELKRREVACECLDCLAMLSPAFSKFIADWHVRIYQYTPVIFDKGYQLMEHTADPDGFSPIYELLSLGAGKLKRYVTDGGYQGILCVHAFAAAMVTEAVKKHGLCIPSFLVATDYTCSPTVEQSDLDFYFVPHEQVRGEFTLAGIPEHKQVVTGIPVLPQFCRQADKHTARVALGIPEEGTVVLVMCGSMGAGPIQTITQEVLEQMPENGTMVALCGRNEKLREEMQMISDPRLLVRGYIQNFPDYLDAADLIITKPGGLSSTEAACKHVPMVFINIVGGCENRNFDLFLKNGYAMGSRNIDQVVRIAIRMTWDTQGREKIRQTLQRDFDTNAAQAIADFVITKVGS